jgi:hypothetical protein
MYHHVQAHYPVVTKMVLLQLVNAVIKNAPEYLHPRPPTRSEKRAKAGLMLWIDNHARQVLAYLSLHHPEQ